MNMAMAIHGILDMMAMAMVMELTRKPSVFTLRREHS
jgi:hypothetical protein